MNDIVSVMCVTFNRLALTKQTIESLSKQTDYPFRLIIIDNGSIDGTVEYLKELNIDNKYCQSYDFKLNKENLGIATGRNQCLVIANKYNDMWLSTIDNDVLFINQWTSKCVNVLKVNPNFSIGLNAEDVNYPIVNLNGYDVQLKPRGNIGTFCTMFPRDLHDRIGFFVSYGLYGEDDASFFIRSRVAGYKMGYLPENGIHLGVGENDVGEYREFKHKAHAENLEKFKQDCYSYYNKTKSIYQSFIE